MSTAPESVVVAFDATSAQLQALERELDRIESELASQPAELLGVIEDILAEMPVPTEGPQLEGVRGLRARAQRLAGQAHFAQADHRSAAERYQTALKEALDAMLPDEAGETLARIGELHLRLGNHPEALRSLREALRLEDLSGDTAGEAGVLQQLGTLYLHTANAAEASRHFQRALDLYRSLGDRRAEGACLGGLAAACLRADQREEALKHLEQARELCEEFRDPGALAGYYLEMAGIFAADRSGPKALYYYQKALETARLAADRVRVVMAHLGLARLYLTPVSPVMDTQRAAIHLADCELMISLLKRDDLRVEFLNLQAQRYEAEGAPIEALSALKSAHSLEQQLRREDGEHRLRLLQVAYEVDRVKSESRAHQVEKETLVRLNSRILEQKERLANDREGLVRLQAEAHETLATVADALGEPAARIESLAHELLELPATRAQVRARAEAIAAAAAEVRLASGRLERVRTVLINRRQIPCTAVALSPLVEAMVEVCRPRAEAAAAELLWSLDTAEDTVQANEFSVCQVLDLVLTAHLACLPSGGTLNIRLQAGEGRRVLTFDGAPAEAIAAQSWGECGGLMLAMGGGLEVGGAGVRLWFVC